MIGAKKLTKWKAWVLNQISSHFGKKTISFKIYTVYIGQQKLEHLSEITWRKKISLKMKID